MRNLSPHVHLLRPEIFSLRSFHFCRKLNNIDFGSSRVLLIINQSFLIVNEVYNSLH